MYMNTAEERQSLNSFFTGIFGVLSGFLRSRTQTESE